MLEPFAWTVSVQNWQGYHRVGPQPPVKTETFPTKPEAEARKAELRRLFPDPDEVVICVTPRRPKPKQRRR